MNRSLLLLICDFLVLSLLALANFDDPGAQVEDPDPVEEQTIDVDELDAKDELMEALRIALDDERASREELQDDLNLTQQELAERERAIAEREARLAEMARDLEDRKAESEKLEQEREELREQVAEVAAEKEVLAQERARQEEEARRARERALAMERQLQEKLQELEKTEATLARLEVKQREVEEANQRLSTELELSESEKRLIRENLDQVRTEVQLVRAEKERIQKQAGELAEGVTLLAERSGELVQEVRRSQPKTANMIFSDFQNNHLRASFTRNRPLYLRVSNSETRTVLVGDGEKVYAIVHIDDIGINLQEAGEFRSLSATLSAAGQAGRVTKLSFLSLDPRLLVVEVNETIAERFGTEVYKIAQEPFKFPEAVLIGSSGEYYGETTFTVDSENSRYVKMQTRIFSRLFGELSPSRGDLVFSKTGEFIGMMVTNEYCALIDNFLLVPDAVLPMGDNLVGVSRTLAEMRDRVNQLPRRFR